MLISPQHVVKKWSFVSLPVSNELFFLFPTTIFYFSQQHFFTAPNDNFSLVPTTVFSWAQQQFFFCSKSQLLPADSDYFFPILTTGFFFLFTPCRWEGVRTFDTVVTFYGVNFKLYNFFCIKYMLCRIY